MNHHLKLGLAGAWLADHVHPFSCRAHGMYVVRNWPRSVCPRDPNAEKSPADIRLSWSKCYIAGDWTVSTWHYRRYWTPGKKSRELQVRVRTVSRTFKDPAAALDLLNKLVAAYDRMQAKRVAFAPDPEPELMST